MHLLVLGVNYAPEVTSVAPFTTGLAEYLAQEGHRVTVATTFPHYPQWRVQSPYVGRWRTAERRNSVDVLRSRVLLPRDRSALARVCFDTSFGLSSLINTWKLPRADVVLCVSPPVQIGLTGALLAWRWRAPLVMLVKDLPLDLAVAVGMLQPGLAYRMGRKLEQVVYRLSDHIIVISRGFRDRLLHRGVPKEKIIDIPDWADTETVRPLPPDLAVRGQLGAGPEDFLLVHAGNMGEKQGLGNVVATAQALESRRSVKFALVGDGSDRGRLEELIASCRLGNLALLPLQPADRFPKILAAADALLLNQRPHVIDSVAPSKLLTYMAAGRPVLAAVHARSEAANLIGVANCGLVVEPDQPDALAAAVLGLQVDPSMRAQLGANGRRHVERHFARDQVLARYEAFFSSLISQSTRAAWAGG